MNICRQVKRTRNVKGFRMTALDNSNTSLIIIGASHAGLSCAEALRKGGFDGVIGVIERDSGTPLQRPPLSKTYLDADEGAGEDSFYLRRSEWFAQFDISLHEGCEVTKISRADKQVHLDDGRVLSYDKLVIASGAVARKLPIAGGTATGVHVLRTAADARRLRASLGTVKDAVVIGGGYIGLEAAASLHKVGKSVHVVELAPRLLARVASPLLSDYCTALHRAAGVTVSTGAACDEILTDDTGAVRAVLLADGTELPCQLVLAGIGVIPDTGLASAAGLAVDNGIIVSRAYRTDDDAIWAIGDVARAPSRYELRIESIHHAQASSQIAAADMMGGELPADEALWFWSDQYDVKFQMAGMLPSVPEGALQHVSRAGRRDHSLSVWSWCDRVLVTVEAANDGQAYMIGKKCLEAGISPDPADIANPDFGLKTLIA